MKKKIASILTVLVLLMVIPAVLVLAAPSGFSFLASDPSGEPSVVPTGEPSVVPSGDPSLQPSPEVSTESTEAVEPTDEATPSVSPELTPPALERVQAAAALGIPPGRLLHIDTLAQLLGWTREQTLAQYGNASIQDIMKLTNQLRHSGKGHHPVVTPMPSPSATPVAPTAESPASPTPEAPAV